MALLVAVASGFDFAEALDETGERPLAMDRRKFGLLSRQAADGGAITIRAPDGGLALITGLYPSPEGWFEGWWAVGPAMRAHLRPVMRVGRRLFEEIAEDAAPLDVRAHVPADSVAGHRIAPLFGFHEAGQVDIGHGPWTVWRRLFPAPEL